MKVLGLDIGGANIKAATSDGTACHRPFALWQRPADLRDELHDLRRQFADCQLTVITMTGELTDCFDHKQEGVEFIVKAVQNACDDDVAVYVLDGRMVDCACAIEHTELAAASNWHGLANFVATQFTPGSSGLLVDIGSTTSDLIPFGDRRVLARGRDDFQRLVRRELVYTGVVRSALNGIVRNVSHQGEDCPVMNELFATTLDTNIVLGHLTPESETAWAADGGQTSVGGCVRRLARMVGKDELTFTLDDAREMAGQVEQCQLNMLENAAVMQLQRLAHADPVMVISGQGEFLARRLFDRLSAKFPSLCLLSLSDQLGTGLSGCAPAYAIARLAAETQKIKPVDPSRSALR